MACCLKGFFDVVSVVISSSCVSVAVSGVVCCEILVLMYWAPVVVLSFRLHLIHAFAVA